jgi:acetyl-CoA carboxylase alpha subunit
LFVYFPQGVRSIETLSQIAARFCVPLVTGFPVLAIEGAATGTAEEMAVALAIIVITFLLFNDTAPLVGAVPKERGRT